MHLTYRSALRLLASVGPVCVGGISAVDFLCAVNEVIQLFHQEGHGVTCSSLNMRPAHTHTQR